MRTAAYRLSCPKRPSPKCDGVTLLEALVVIAILALLAALAAPSFRDLLASQRVQGVTSDLFMGLMKTRSEAIKLDVRVSLAPKAGGWQNGWQIINGVTGAVLDDHQATNGVTFTSAPAGSVTYQSSGRIQGGATVNFEVTSATVSTAIRCVSIDPSGRPNVKASAC